jgi:hypothetical protein
MSLNTAGAVKGAGGDFRPLPYRAAGRPAEAIERHEATLNRREVGPRPNHPHTLHRRTTEAGDGLRSSGAGGGIDAVGPQAAVRRPGRPFLSIGLASRYATSDASQCGWRVARSPDLGASALASPETTSRSSCEACQTCDAWTADRSAAFCCSRGPRPRGGSGSVPPTGRRAEPTRLPSADGRSVPRR